MRGQGGTQGRRTVTARRVLGRAAGKTTSRGPTQPLVEFLHLAREPQLREVASVDQHIAIGHLDGVSPRMGVRDADEARVARWLGGIVRHRVHPAGEREQWGSWGLQGRGWGGPRGAAETAAHRPISSDQMQSDTDPAPSTPGGPPRSRLDSLTHKPGTFLCSELRFTPCTTGTLEDWGESQRLRVTHWSLCPCATGFITTYLLWTKTAFPNFLLITIYF